MIWPFSLLSRRAACGRPPNARETAAIKQVRELLSATADEPLWPSKAPMGQEPLRRLLLRCAGRAPAGSPERTEFCRLFVETARFQPAAEQASREMEAMFSPGGTLGAAGLVDVTNRLHRAERQVETERADLRRQLRSHGLLG